MSGLSGVKKCWVQREEYREHPDWEMLDGLAVGERIGRVMCLKLHGGLGNQGMLGLSLKGSNKELPNSNFDLKYRGKG